MQDHDCREHLVFQQHDWVETHGLDCGPYERCHEEWWQCSECHEQYTDKELQQMNTQENTYGKSSD